MNRISFELEKILSSFLLHREEFPPGGSSVVRFYRTKSSLFRFIRKRCALCRHLPRVLYYDSPQLGFVCDECHTRAMAKRIELLGHSRTKTHSPALRSFSKKVSQVGAHQGWASRSDFSVLNTHRASAYQRTNLLEREI